MFLTFRDVQIPQEQHFEPVIFLSQLQTYFQQIGPLASVASHHDPHTIAQIVMPGPSWSLRPSASTFPTPIRSSSATRNPKCSYMLRARADVASRHTGHPCSEAIASIGRNISLTLAFCPSPDEDVRSFATNGRCSIFLGADRTLFRALAAAVSRSTSAAGMPSSAPGPSPVKSSRILHKTPN
jgi:hypothetical protein